MSAQEVIVRTAGEPDHIILTADRMTIDADDKDLAYIKVKVVDKVVIFARQTIALSHLRQKEPEHVGQPLMETQPALTFFTFRKCICLMDN